MLAIVDRKVPVEAKEKLSEYCKIIELSTQGITCDYLSGHPDIFMCRVNNLLICSPSLPAYVKEELTRNNINFVSGTASASAYYPECARYNAVVTQNLLLHKVSITEKIILESARGKTKIDINQGMTRCSVLPLPDESFITSDEKIFQTLTDYGYECLFVSSKDVLLPGMKYGLFGGTCAIQDNVCFFLGNLLHYSEGLRVKSFLEGKDIKIIELYDGPLFDGGSIIFLR